MNKPEANHKLLDTLGDLKKPLPISYSLIRVKDSEGDINVVVTSDFYRATGYECTFYHNPISKILNKGHESA